MVKILIATDNYLPRWDGIARFLEEIIPRLKSKGHNISVIAPNYKGEYKNKHKISITRTPLQPFSIGDFTPAKKPKKKVLAELVREADIVFVQTIGPVGEAAIREAKKQRKHLLGYNHSVEWELVPHALPYNFLQKISRALALGKAKKLYNQFDLLLTPSVEISEKLSWYKIRPKKIVVQLGVDTKTFTPPKSKEEAKKKIGLSAEQTIITYAGRLGREKDLKTLFRAFIRLRKDYDEIRLLVVGGGLKSITDMVRNRKDVEILGKQNNIAPYLQATDIYVLPSLTETTSLSTLEAMACQAIPVSTSVGLVKHYIRNGENGFLFNKKNVYMLTKRIEKILNNKELAKKLSINAAKTAKEYDWEKTANKLDEVLKKL
ncbi:glycosyltransferase family 4 protein [Candidatus Woesearchaeota archaeon]|nr:glycosyltransferase family 4 protein [Candidatus Woesearchaeota archaeon]